MDRLRQRADFLAVANGARANSHAFVVQGRRRDDEVTCFINNIGLGYQFAAAGSVVYQKAKAAGIGHDLPTDWFTEDVHP